MPALAVDLGGTFLRCGVALDSGEVVAIARTRILNFVGGAEADEIWEAVLSGIDAYGRENEARLEPGDPIVFCFPGPIQDGASIVAAPTVTGARSAVPDLAAELRRRTGRDVHLLNDVSAAAWYLSGIVDADRLMVVTVSSGIGSKIFDRRHPRGVIDDVPYAGEIGHCVVDRSVDAPTCDCGGRGHLGAIASGRGTERLARRRAAADPASFARSACAREFGATAQTLTNEEHFVPAVRAGDAWSLDVLQAAAQPLADVISAAAFAAGIRRVEIIGGFALEIGPRYIECLERCLAPQSGVAGLGLPASGFVAAATPHPEACLFGAARFAGRLPVHVS
jgi:predicted NBD/HSP70 family sugar kinase